MGKIDRVEAVTSKVTDGDGSIISEAAVSSKFLNSVLSALTYLFAKC